MSEALFVDRPLKSSIPADRLKTLDGTAEPDKKAELKMSPAFFHSFALIFLLFFDSHIIPVRILVLETADFLGGGLFEIVLDHLHGIDL